MADTNNHAVRVVDLASATTSTLILKGIEEFSPPPDADGFFGEVIELGALVSPGAGAINLKIVLPSDHKVNETAPSSAEFAVDGGVVDFGPNASVSLTGTSFPLALPVEFKSGEGELTADLTVIYCHEDAESLCFIQQLRFLVAVSVRSQVPTDVVDLSYQIRLPDF